MATLAGTGDTITGESARPLASIDGRREIEAAHRVIRPTPKTPPRLFQLHDQLTATFEVRRRFLRRYGLWLWPRSRLLAVATPLIRRADPVPG